MRIHIGEAEPILVLAVLILGPIILVSCWRTLGNDSKRAVIMPHDENFEDVCGLQYDLMVSIMMHEDTCFGCFIGFLLHPFLEALRSTHIRFHCCTCLRSGGPPGLMCFVTHAQYYYQYYVFEYEDQRMPGQLTNVVPV